jgi:hypothetical protein
LAFNCQITRNNTPKTTTFISFAENLKLLWRTVYVQKIRRNEI